MAFRKEDEIEKGSLRAVQYLIDQLEPNNRKKSKEKLLNLITKFGPVVEAYPHWHPLVSANPDYNSPITRPSERCGYRGLDHTIYLRNAFISCPYTDPNALINSVENLNHNPVAIIEAELLDFPLYLESANPVLVRCDWGSSPRKLSENKSISSALAIPLALELELPRCRDSQFAETWETMRPYILGRPHGSLSSLFLERDAGIQLKRIWKLLVASGAFGPDRNQME